MYAHKTSSRQSILTQRLQKTTVRVRSVLDSVAHAEKLTGPTMTSDGQNHSSYDTNLAKQYREQWWLQIRPQFMNSVIPVPYLLLVLGFIAFVENPLVLIVIAPFTFALNLSLGILHKRFSRVPNANRQLLDKLEWVRLPANFIFEGLHLYAYCPEAPIWILSLPGAIGYATMWRGRKLQILTSVNVFFLIGLMVMAGSSSAEIIIMVGAYLLVAIGAQKFMVYNQRLAQTHMERVTSTLRDEQEGLREQISEQRISRLNPVGQMAAGVAHEINNPLFTVLGNLSLCIQTIERTALHSNEETLKEVLLGLEDAQAGALLIRNIVARVNQYARGQSKLNQEPVSIKAIVEQWAAREFPTKASGISVSVTLNDTPFIWGSRTNLEQILGNLFGNAVDAVQNLPPEHRKISISTHTDNNERTLLKITNNGEVIPSHLLSKLFTPFYSTKPGTGTGLGLAIVHEIVTGMKGRVDVQSDEQVTVFQVSFPPYRGAIPATLPKKHSSSGTERPLSILLIDDNERVGHLMAQMMKAHHVTYVAGAQEALDVLSKKSTFDVVLCDVVMPKTSGLALYTKVERLMPDLTDRWAFITGGAITEKDRAALQNATCPVLQKPVDMAALQSLLGSFSLRTDIKQVECV